MKSRRETEEKMKRVNEGKESSGGDGKEAKEIKRERWLGEKDVSAAFEK